MWSHSKIHQPTSAVNHGVETPPHPPPPTPPPPPPPPPPPANPWAQKGTWAPQRFRDWHLQKESPLPSAQGTLGGPASTLTVPPNWASDTSSFPQPTSRPHRKMLLVPREAQCKFYSAIHQIPVSSYYGKERNAAKANEGGRIWGTRRKNMGDEAEEYGGRGCGKWNKALT